MDVNQIVALVLSIIAGSVAIILALIAGGRQVVKALQEMRAEVRKVDEKVDENTTLTQDVRTATNGRLTAALNRVQGLLALLRERDERLAYVIARHPEVEATLAQYGKTRSRPVTAADEVATLAHLMGEEPKP